MLLQIINNNFNYVRKINGEIKILIEMKWKYAMCRK